MKKVYINFKRVKLSAYVPMYEEYYKDNSIEYSSIGKIMCIDNVKEVLYGYGLLIVHYVATSRSRKILTFSYNLKDIADITVN